MEKHIPPRALCEELREIAEEANPGEVIRLLEEENLLSLFSPALAGPKLNLPGFQKLVKVRQLLPFGVDLRIDHLAVFLNLLGEKLTPKERASLATHIMLDKRELSEWQKLESKAKKLETEVKSPKLHRPSQIYSVLAKAPGEQVILLLLRSQQRLVQDRIRNYLQKYVVTAQEVTDADVIARGAKPGTPKFEKVKQDMISARLDARPKKPAVEPVEPPPAPVHAARR
jgi:hypothetical protein